MMPLLKHAEEWTRRGVAVTLIDEWNALFYSGMVPEHLGGVYSPEQVQIDLRQLCAAAGVTFRQARVTALSLDPPGIVTSSGETVPCDLAVFDIGSVNPHREQAGSAVLTKPLHHIAALERFVREALTERTDTQHVTIVGGGAAGVEIALNLSARVCAVRPEAIHLTVFEPSDALLPHLPAELQREVRRRLERRGVSVRLSTEVKACEDGHVLLKDGTRIAADCVLWATGSAGPPLFRNAGLPVDGKGFLRVADTMQCPSTPWLFAAGDCATLAGHPHMKKIGVNAVKQGPTLRANVDRALGALQSGLSLDTARFDTFAPYPVTPLILSTGEPTGLWVSAGIWLRGGSILRLKHFVDRRWMRKYSPTWRDASLRRLFGREAAAANRATSFVS